MAECPVCHKKITGQGYEFGTEFKQRCLKCSCGAYVVINAKPSEILRKAKELAKNGKSGTFSQVEVTDRLDGFISDVWFKLKDYKERMIWRNEGNLVCPFYSELKTSLSQLNDISSESQFYLIPRYSTKSSKYTKILGKKYPVRKKGKKELTRSRPVDLAIISFDHVDFKNKIMEPSATYWYIKHAPLFLLEFKFATPKELINGMKEDLQKMTELQRTYEGVKRVYFCYLTGELPPEKEVKETIKKTGIKNLKICYGTIDGKLWGVKDFSKPVK